MSRRENNLHVWGEGMRHTTKNKWKGTRAELEEEVSGGLEGRDG